MFGRAIGILLISFITSACAQPKYESAPNQKDQGTANSQKVSDCQVRFQKSGLCVLWNWEKAPTEQTAGSLQFKVVRANAMDDSPVPVESEIMPTVLLWMPEMGHGSTPTSTSRIDVGSYQTQNVFFIMPGLWEIHFQVKDGDTLKDEAVAIFTL